MAALHLKIRSIRLLRNLTQEQTALLAFMNLKTYQRKEAGKSPITEHDLEKLALAFKCEVADIREFNSQSGLFKKFEIEVLRLEKENQYLNSEVLFLRSLVNELMSHVEKLPQDGVE